MNWRINVACQRHLLIFISTFVKLQWGCQWLNCVPRSQLTTNQQTQAQTHTFHFTAPHEMCICSDLALTLGRLKITLCVRNWSTLVALTVWKEISFRGLSEYLSIFEGFLKCTVYKSRCIGILIVVYKCSECMNKFKLKINL